MSNWFSTFINETSSLIRLLDKLGSEGSLPTYLTVKICLALRPMLSEVCLWYKKSPVFLLSSLSKLMPFSLFLPYKAEAITL
jgi:hypothetical protein